MDITYNLRINQITRMATYENVEDVVIKVEFYVNAYSPINPTLGFGSIFVVDFSEDDFDLNNFVPYTDLNPSLITSWVLQKLNLNSIDDLPMVKDAIDQTRVNLEREYNKIIDPVYWDVNVDSTIAESTTLDTEINSNEEII